MKNLLYFERRKDKVPFRIIFKNYFPLSNLEKIIIDAKSFLTPFFQTVFQEKL